MDFRKEKVIAIVKYSRVYESKLREYAKLAGLGSSALIFVLFVYLSSIGAIEITGYSGDIICAGTELEPCYAYINFTAKRDIFIYPINDTTWMFNTEPKVKSIIMQRKWGDSWRTINLSKPCNGAWCGCYWCTKNKTAKYAYVFRAGKSYQLRFIGYKSSPYDDVKWGFANLDPIWYGIKPEKINIQIDNETTMQYYRLSFNGITLLTPVHTKCIWYASKPLRECVQPVYIINNLTEITLSKNLFKYKFQTNRFKNMKVEFPNKLVKGNNTIYFKFEYPPNQGEEWNLSFSNGIYDWKIDPTITACSTINESGIYTLENNITDGVTNCIDIDANDVVFDCQGFMIDGTAISHYGIYVYRSSTTDANVTVKNCKMQDWSSYAVYLYRAQNCKIFNFTVSDADGFVYAHYSDNLIINLTKFNSNSKYEGIYGYSSDQLKILNSNITTEGYGVVLGSSTGTSIVNSNIIGGVYSIKFPVYISNYCDLQLNNVYGSNNLPILFYNSATTIQNWNNNFSEIILCGASNTLIQNVTWNQNKGTPFYIAISDYVTFDNVVINGSQSGYGIYIDIGSNYLNIKNSKFSNLKYGIHGVAIVDSNITNNTFFDNQYGIYALSNKNKIFFNNFSSWNDYAIYIGSSSVQDNVIYNNYFLKTPAQSYLYFANSNNYANTSKQLGTRIYSEGPYIGGNYWAHTDGTGYSETCTDANHDGFCDDSFNCGTNCVDYLPYSDEYQLISVSNATFNQTNVTQGKSVRLNVTLYPEGSVDTAWSTWEYPNGTQVNKTIYKLWLSSFMSDDLEQGTQSFEGQLGGTFTFFDDFDDGDLGSNWTTYSSQGVGRIDVRTEDAYSDGYSVIADVSSSGTFNLNELITNYDFSGATSVYLTFYAREWGDEANSGADHTGHYDSDSVYFTCDGNQWYLLYDLTSLSTSWSKIEINISADPDWCGTINSSFAIKFTQYDNYALTSDGIGWDDINITYTKPGQATESNITPVEYQDTISKEIINLTKINVTVYVSYYNNSGSVDNGNNNPDLYLEIYNGTDWIGIDSFSVSGTGNYTLSTTDSSILSAWETVENRDIRIKGIYFDINETTGNKDIINYTNVWIFISGKYHPENWFTYVWNDTTKAGVYYVRYIFVNDTSGDLINESYGNSLNFTVLANQPPTTPTNITCNGGICNGTFTDTVLMQCSGSTDPNNDLITYFLYYANNTEYCSGTPNDCDSYDDQTNCTIAGCTWLGDYNDSVNNAEPEYRLPLSGDELDVIDDFDSTGAGVSPTWVSNIIPQSPYNQCGDYDGSSTVTKLPDKSDLNTAVTSKRAISVWFIADTIDTTGNGRIIYEEGGGTNWLNLYVHEEGGEDRIYFTMGEGGNTGVVDYVYCPISTGQLYHVGVIVDMQNQEIYMYLNGQMCANDTDGLNIGTDLAKHTGDIGVGGPNSNPRGWDLNSVTGYFDGRIADIMIWGNDVTLPTGEDMIAIYESGMSKCGGTPNQCGYYNDSQSNCELVGCTWNPIEYVEIGNHTEGNSYTWDISGFENGKTIEKFKCFAIDLDGSNTPSDDFILDVNFVIQSITANLTVWNGSSWIDIDEAYLPIFICGKNNPTQPGAACYDYNVAPEYQTDSQPILNLTNIGTSTGDGKLRLNGTLDDITIFCDDDNDYVGAVKINTSYQTICSNLAADSSCSIWCWANFTGFMPPAPDVKFEATVE